jgi:hypothetical protein
LETIHYPDNLPPPHSLHRWTSSANKRKRSTSLAGLLSQPVLHMLLGDI